MKFWMLLFLMACPKPSDTDTSEVDDTDVEDTDVEDTDVEDTDVEVVLPGLVDGLGDCMGVFSDPPTYPNQLSFGTDMHRLTLDAEHAVCNDGTPAVLYVREAPDESPNSDKWVMHTQGGSGCGSFESCMVRWCGPGFYDASKMSSTYSPITASMGGINAWDTGNEFASYNQVYFYYCSSDGWKGQSTMTVKPEEGADTDASWEYVPEAAQDGMVLEFRGHQIIEAAFELLRAGGAASDDAEQTMPDLDDASAVLWTGTSAGSGGAIRHVDWVANELSANGTIVKGAFDAAIPLSLDVWEDDTVEDALAAAYEANQTSETSVLSAASFMDESCVSATSADDIWRCNSTDYYLFHHVTTPFIVRMDVSDPKFIEKYSYGLWGDDEESYDAPYLTGLMRESLALLPSLSETAAEGEDITVTPGVYGPDCGEHVGMESTSVFTVSQINDEGDGRSFYEAMLAWLEGYEVNLVDTDGESSYCASD